ncbi:alpha/beta hydrolase [Paenibacillus silvae]|uniref:Alpha-xylosidase n=1 Tax=Paenibacillus silvae TaxID=1325358 RepID=A0ABQ1ZF00_9BACL|nr:alpha/beta hydrolase family protein [Paenibacillus silvae]MCK6074188.1 esterase family protein [Paenibacillus silvae]MCK6148334.1 esterase family protein [Paenibacillus silvae]MCK6266634.1 esterase family protein [Paenibacillus silvae]GGH58758.1 alpha-xylosidase [Paenibacillus silvae]
MATVQVNFFSKSMRREVSFNALLPVDLPVIPGQSETAIQQQPLKSLYLLNGYSGNQWDWITFTRIRELADRYRIAVFMPAGENHFYVDDEDKGELYGQYVGQELVAFTRELFPLSTRREHTFIGGLSMGGYGAIRNGLKYAEHFGGIIALSSAILPYKIANAEPGYSDGIADYKYFTRVFGDLSKLEGSDKDPEALVMQLKESGALIPNIYMACGTEDFLLDVNQRFRDFLLREHVPVTYTESAGVHNWDFWNDYITLALDWLASNEPSEQ